MKPKPTKSSSELILPPYCQDNPLIDGILPLPSSLVKLYNKIAGLPPKQVHQRQVADKFGSLLDLAVLEDVYVPTARDLRTATVVIRNLLKGLADRRPSGRYWREHEVVCKRVTQSVSSQPPRNASAACAAIVGVSGSGKSTLIENLLSEITQIVEHDQRKNPLLPRHQVVWIKVTCPVNRTPRAFITEFFTELDRLTDSNYAKAYARHNDDELIVAMARVARIHFVGLLVIDEIQNAVAKSPDADRRLLKLLVRLTSTVRVPMLFIGTPKSQNVLNAELADARRMIGPQWLPFKATDKDFDLILDTLWAYVSPTAMPSDVREVLYDISQGIPALAKSAIGLTKERLIVNATKRPELLITAPALRETATEEMQSVAGAVNALRTNSGFDVYDDLLPEQLPKPKSWNDDAAKSDRVAREYYEDALFKEARKAARDRIKELTQGIM